MIRLIECLRSCTLLLLATSMLAGEDKIPSWQTRQVAEVFSLPEQEAHDLVMQHLSDTELYAQVLKAMQTGTATLEKLIAVTSKDGLRASVEQIDEYLYPTEFDPAQVPQLLAIADPGATTPTQPAPPMAARSPFNAGLGTLTTTTPTAFEMLPLGDRWEVDSDVSDGNSLTITSSLSTNELLHVDHVRDIPLPLFAKRKRQAKSTLTSDEPLFLGTYDAAPQPEAGATTLPKMRSLAFLTSRREGILSKGKPNPGGEPFGAQLSPPGSARATVEVISMNKASAHSLLREKLDDPALHARVAKMIEQRLATRETMVAYTFKSGNRSSMESVQEWLYPTEFDPPQIPMQLVLADHDLLHDLRSGKQSGLGTPSTVDGKATHGGFGLITTTSPTAFERRPLGIRFEMDPAFDQDLFDITLSIEITRLTGTVDYGGIKHPVVGNQHLQTCVLTHVNNPVLLGTLAPATHTGFDASCKDDRVWLAFLRVTVN